MEIMLRRKATRHDSQFLLHSSSRSIIYLLGCGGVDGAGGGRTESSIVIADEKVIEDIQNSSQIDHHASRFDCWHGMRAGK